MRKRKHRLIGMRRKLFILIFITLIPLTFLVVYEIKSNFTSSINQELNSSQDYCEAISSSFTNYITKVWTNQYSIGLSMALNKKWTQSDIEQFMNAVLPYDNGIFSYTWLKPNGDVVTSTSAGVRGKNISDRDYVQAIMNGKDKVIGDLRYASNGYDLIIPVARAIRINGVLQGIIISNIDIKRLESVLPATRTAKSSRYGLVDKNGRIVYANDSRGLAYDQRMIPETSNVWKALNGEIYRYRFKISDFDGSKQVGVDYPIKDIGWGCYATSPISEITGIQIKRVKNDLIALILVYIVSFIIAFLIGRQHIYSINKIKDATNKALYKDENYKTECKGDEYEEVVDAFNQITEGYNQKINEVEEYSNLKANFMATMSHELKTPLNIILGCVQLMEIQVIENESFKKYLKILKQNSFRLLRLINNFIDINKIEVENLTLNLVNDDIIRVIEDISLSIVDYTNLKNLEIIFDTEVEEKYMAFDHDKIERILLNLLSNSIKFTETGGVIMINIFDKDDHIVVSVKDNGIGIPKEMQNKIFDRFVQVDSTLRRRAEGSGIGLSLVKSLVELHDGIISVKSELGEGSEFIIELPVKQVEKKLQASIEGSLSNVEKIKIEFSDIYT
ncbi:sensor histidine kinase [Clostridium folliculivorans]|uniref:histidine kinase n=1 Tax=Clostridium folliculivorans TaxID=2886038 RepID=A0A9W6DBQ5_9CLOT|nr:sensor histidine kinase [Clostridium folliculivorans]GKU26685.1 hypothetical protein CFOLD11_35120 [Clostridium folliculivorans]GKU28883.1 hypothetical protein CFB3_09890 [Clostridium folliculivorans]